MTVIERFGGGLNLNVYFHTLRFDGVFTKANRLGLRFAPLPAPTDEEVAVVLAIAMARSL